MRILQATAFFPPHLGGIERYVLNLSLNLSELGHQVDILTINTNNALKSEEIAPNVNVRRCHLDFRYRKGLISVEFIRRVLMAKGYDIYHIHIPFPSGLEATVLAARLNKIPLVATHHGDSAGYGVLHHWLSAGYGVLYRTLSLRFPNRVIFLSQSYPDSLRLSNQVRQKITVVKASPLERFSPLVDGTKLREQFGFTPDNKVILCVASLNKFNRYKGVDRLLRAMSHIAGCNGIVRLVIVGGGELLPELKQLSSTLGVDKVTVFTDFISDEQLPACYAMSDLFVLPSLSAPENSPMTLLEAMAVGRASVASNLPGVQEIIQHGENGCLVSPDDPQGLAEAILSLLANDERRNRMAQNARRTIETNSWEKVTSAVLGIYSEVIAR